MRKFYICLMSFILTITTVLPVYAENTANDLVKQLQQSFAHVTETADLAHENTMKEEEPTEPVLVPYSDSIPIYMTQDEAEQIELEAYQPHIEYQTAGNMRQEVESVAQKIIQLNLYPKDCMINSADRKNRSSSI